MKNSTKYAAFLAFTAIAVAAGSAFAADTGKTKIVRIAPWSGSTQIQTEASNSCNTSKQLTLPDTAAHERNFNIAMAALLAGRNVDINYSCSGSTANIISIRVY